MAAKVMVFENQVFFLAMFSAVIASGFLFGYWHKKSVSTNVTRFFILLYD